MIRFPGNLITICIGLAASWTSPILIKLEDADNTDNPLGYAITNDQASWIASLISIGCIIGAIPLGFVANRIGRKYELLLTGVMYFIAFMMGAFATVIEVYYAMRILSGIALGGSVLLGMYISEIAHHKDRGTLTSTAAFTAYVGVLIPYLLGPYMSIMAFNLICAGASVLFCVLFAFAPETPHFLVSRGKVEEARKALSRLRNDPQEMIEKEFESIKDHVESHEHGTVIDIFKSRVLIKCLLIAMMMNFLLHSSGIATLAVYSQEVFELAGTSIPSSLDAIIVGVIQTIMGVLAMLVIQKLKFKKLMMFGLTFVAISNVLTGTYFFLKEATSHDVSSYSWWPIVSIAMGFCAYSFGVVTVIGVVTNEIFPTSVRSPAYALVQTFGFAESFLINKFFMNLMDGLGTYGCFWLFGLMSAIGVVLVKLFLIETNGKTFEEIQQILANNKSKENKTAA